VGVSGLGGSKSFRGITQNIKFLKLLKTNCKRFFPELSEESGRKKKRQKSGGGGGLSCAKLRSS
jgi:hypothetical protein